ncbi:MAG: PA2778 family cysteine peptidase [Methylophilaceae bacterium]|nr:PA2778 family cysteine peptidase [Methylophilaceae bacterium]
MISIFQHQRLFKPIASSVLRRTLLALGVYSLVFLLGACATSGVREVKQNTQLPRQVELTETPFYPQELYQCGPAALATAINAIDIKVSPEQLTPEVYIPSRQGSLQIEMLAAARRHGALAIQIPPNLQALLEEIAAGNVVVVMQNLGLSWAPSWHYAVVVGYDLDKELIWLRSGTFERFEMTLSTFQRTWARSQQWAFVTLKPGDLPATPEPDQVIRALIAFEKTAPAIQAKAAYEGTVKRWPDNLVLLMGLGNSAYAAKDLAASAEAFRQAIAAHPDSAAAHNNLAHVSLAKGDVSNAKQYAEEAMRLAAEDEKLQAQIKQTLIEIAAKEK